MAVDFYLYGVPCQRSKSGPNVRGLHPEMRFRLAEALADERLSGSAVYSATRTLKHQAELRKINGCPDVYKSPASTCRIPTAIPGRSLHNPRPTGTVWGELKFEVPWAIAADISFAGRPSKVVDPIMKSYGLHRIPSETWHWQLNPSGALNVIAGEGSRGDAVKRVQGALNEHAGVGLLVDGIYGKATGDAVAAFQKQHGLLVRRDWTREEQELLSKDAASKSDRWGRKPVKAKDPDYTERQALRQIRAIATKALKASND